MIEELQKLISIDYDISLAGLSLDTKLSVLQEQDESFDSLNRVSFLIEVEKHFNVDLPSKTNTLQEILNVIEQGKDK